MDKVNINELLEENMELRALVKKLQHTIRILLYKLEKR